MKDDALLASPFVLPQNNEWWIELEDWLNDTHSWSISAVTSIAWAIITYVFTVVDSVTTDLGPSIQANGQAVRSLWLWLLPIIITSWLMMSPKCDPVRLSSMIECANRISYVATDRREPKNVLSNSQSWNWIRSLAMRSARRPFTITRGSCLG